MSLVHRVVVFDFDGTCTVPAEGGDTVFIRAHQAGLAALLGQSVEVVEAGYMGARARIAAEPDVFGWEINGQIVAPALVDAFVEAQVCAQILLTALGEDLGAWEDRLNDLYQENYLKYQTVFRPELLETLSTLRERGTPFYIVTNSDPAKVRTRLETLGEGSAWIGTLVHGYAKKYVVTATPDSVSENTYFPGLRRPIALRKQHYYNVLAEILQTYGADWRDLLVVGDIAELDLALPVTLGAAGRLVLGPNTPPHEVQWAEEHPRVETIRDLKDLLRP